MNHWDTTSLHPLKFTPTWGYSVTLPCDFRRSQRLMFSGRVGVLYGRVEPRRLVKSCDLGDKSVDLYYKTVEKVCFRCVGGLGGLGGFMVQGLADPGQTLGQSSIQALFLKFSVPSTPHTGGTTTRVIPVEWNPNLKKHPCFEELTTTFFPTLNSP